MDIKKAVVAVDLDGVCADFYGKMREVVAEWYERPIEELTTEVSYGLPELGLPTDDGGKTYASIHRFALHQRGLFRDVEMIPGARRWLRQLSNDGARIRILTHRLFLDYAHLPAVQQTIEWLDHNGIPYYDLCFMKDKAQVGAHVYIDDAPLNILSLREAGLQAICFGNSTNKHIEQPRVEDWESCYHKVREIVEDIP